MMQAYYEAIEKANGKPFFVFTYHEQRFFVDKIDGVYQLPRVIATL